MSPDGRCFTFDERANGYGRGEGIGVVILKRVEDAIRDNDTIRAVIRGTRSNQDGRTQGTYPGPASLDWHVTSNLGQESPFPARSARLPISRACTETRDSTPAERRTSNVTERERKRETFWNFTPSPSRSARTGPWRTRFWSAQSSPTLATSKVARAWQVLSRASLSWRTGTYRNTSTSTCRTHESTLMRSRSRYMAHLSGRCDDHGARC